jgi:hypothetical protein
MPDARTVRVDADIEWRVERTSSPAMLVAVCDGLGISVEAESEDEIPGLIPETMDLLMRDLHGDGELAGYLRARGLRSSRLPPRSARHVTFEVPWHLVPAAA